MNVDFYDEELEYILKNKMHPEYSTVRYTQH